MIEVRDRLTERINRARVEVELKRSRGPLLVIAIGAALGVVLWGYLLVNVGRVQFRDTYQAKFLVRDATSVVEGRHDVRFKGIEVGTITKAELDDGQAVLTAKIEKKYGRLYNDAKAALRPVTALQDMFLDITDRGTKAAGELKEERPLPAANTDVSQSVSEVLDTFAPDVRQRLAILLDQLGNGLAGRGDDLRTTFVRAVPFIRYAGRLSEVLADRDRMTRRLITNFAELTEELGTRDAQLRRLVADGGATLRTLQASSPDLDATLRELPRFLSGLDSSFNRVRGLLPEINSAVRSLTPAAEALPDALDSGVGEYLKGIPPVVDAARLLIPQLMPLARQFDPFAKAVQRATRAIEPNVDAIRQTVPDVAACTIGLYGFFHHTASLFKLGDARGAYPRGDAAVSVNSAGGAAPDVNVRAMPSCLGHSPIRGEP